MIRRAGRGTSRLTCLSRAASVRGSFLICLPAAVRRQLRAVLCGIYITDKVLGLVSGSERMGNQSTSGLVEV